MEGGHRFSALANLVEKFTVGEAVHMPGVDEAGWRGIVQRRIGAVTFPCIAVALRAFIQIDRTGGIESSRGGVEGILPALGFLWNFPFSILIDRDEDRDADKDQKREKKKLAKAEVARRFGNVRQEQIFAQEFEGQKRN